MDQLRWILLGVAIAIVVVVYLFSRNRKKESSYSPLDAVNEIPSFSAEDEVENSWVDGVGPVRVVSKSDQDVIEQFQEEIAVPEKMDIDNPFPEEADELDEHEADPEISDEEIQLAAEAPDNKQADKPADIQQQEVNESTPQKDESKSTEAPVDDVIAVFVMADKNEQPLKGEKILSASFALNLQHGEMKIFHRHSDIDNRILFSMANVFEPGWFDFDDMHHMETRGITFFMQVNLLENPADVLDEMLICAHRMATMLGASLCNAHRQPLDEVYTKHLRQKVQKLSELKAQTV